MNRRDFLVELGCEELPPKALKSLRDAFADGIKAGLAKAGLAHSTVLAFAAPRRLAVHVAALAEQQADSVLSVDGPPVKAAFDAEGKPTPAALGFAKKNGISVEELDRSGEKLRVTKHIRGEATQALLPGIVQASLEALPIAKRMRWGASRVEFVRPTKWLVMLFGEDVVPCEILGQKAGNQSWGHRFMSGEPVIIAVPEYYVQELKRRFVIADFNERREQIKTGVEALARQQGGSALIPDALLDEVAALVEWPVPLVCSFEERFLAVPQEALISTMQDNQKYFCLVDAQGKLMNRFITVANIKSGEPQHIVAGNEKVVRPRLTDAEFFYNTDRKTTLSVHNERNHNIVFQAELGTVHAKAQRMEMIASFVAHGLNSDKRAARRAALLSKADLCTQMVNEFPELQGIMGEYYARHDGEPAEVASALREQYLPRFAGDALPHTKTGIAIALADKLDTLAGLFAIGQPPTGSKDPFALRRASLGVLRILIERELGIALDELVDAALDAHGKNTPAVREAVLDFFFGRYRAMYEEQGIAPEVILSVLAVRPMVPADFDKRVKAVDAFSRLPEAKALAAANKRVANILAREPAAIATKVNDSLLLEAAEKTLFTQLQGLQAKAQQYGSDYAAVLQELASVRAVIDTFFDQVMVNTEDAAVRGNRLALLQQFNRLFLSVADVSLLVPEKT